MHTHAVPMQFDVMLRHSLVCLIIPSDTSLSSVMSPPLWYRLSLATCSETQLSRVRIQQQSWLASCGLSLAGNMAQVTTSPAAWAWRAASTP